MCERVAGELLLSFHNSDTAAWNLLEELHSLASSPHFTVLDSLPGRLETLGLKLREGLQYEFFRLGVPAGLEEWGINSLQHAYYQYVLQDRWAPPPVRPLQVVPNSLLSLASQAPAPAPSPQSGFGTIQLTSTHDVYKALIGLSSPQTCSTPKVLVLDTGISTSQTYNSQESRNFVDHSRMQDVSDDNGHGSAVAAIIEDLCPSIDLVVYKVADQNGRASEWDTLAGLAASNQAKIINLSLAFGLDDQNDPACGRESQSSRSAVFETMVDQVCAHSQGAVILAAAGNRQKTELSFPARFANVLAIESVDANGDLSLFSNYSTVDQDNRPHSHVFVLPGGQKDNNNAIKEHPVETSLGQKYVGTSFATAYATGLLAVAWSDSRYQSLDRDGIIDLLCQNADQNLPSFNSQIHGNGLMKLP